MDRSARHISEESRSPRLAIGGPVLIAASAGIAFAALAAAGLLLVHVETEVRLEARFAPSADVTKVVHDIGGTIARIEVVDGQDVSAGDVLVALETRALDEEIGALKAQLEAARKAVELARLEVATASNLEKRGRDSSEELRSLTRRVSEAMRESYGLSVRLAAAEAGLSRAAVRAPVAGRVRNAARLAPGSIIAGGETILDIEADASEIAFEGSVPAVRAGGLKTGLTASVRISASGRPLQSFDGRLETVTPRPDDGAGNHATVRVTVDRAHAESILGGALQPGLAAEVLLQMGEAQLAGKLKNPLAAGKTAFLTK